jgi:hypothetical protein
LLFATAVVPVYFSSREANKLCSATNINATYQP